MMITRKSLPRRTFLRGMGAAVGLPFLDAMVPALACARRGRRSRRSAWRSSYVPNGIIMDDWNPDYEGKLGELPRILKPLEPYQGRHPAARQPDAQHRARAAGWRGRPRPLLRHLPDRHPGQEDARSISRPAFRATRSWPSTWASRRASRRSKSAWKTRGRRAIAIPATPARTPTTWRGRARRSRCRRCSIRARCLSGCSATAWC